MLRTKLFSWKSNYRNTKNHRSIAPYHSKNVLSLEHSLYCVIVLKYSKGSLFIVIRNKQLEIEMLCTSLNPCVQGKAIENQDSNEL